MPALSCRAWREWTEPPLGRPASDPGATLAERAIAYHAGGKLRIAGRVPLRDRDDLALAYTPGVAEVCRAIAREPGLADRYTGRRNLVAVCSDGTAVLGLGDIGPTAALPVMEGKCLLLSALAGIDAWPLCLRAEDDEALVAAVAALAPCVGGVLLEDVAAPRCFALERELRARMPVPVCHDDQHGTAVVVAAALCNALLATERRGDRPRIVINGAGAAGVAVARLLLHMGLPDIVVCDRAGVIEPGRLPGLTPEKEALAASTNPRHVQGDLRAALRGADVFIGLSAAGAADAEMVAAMAPDPIVFALANPDPEIAPEAARAAGAAIVATGRSDDRNQINNALCFPGLFRGLLDSGAAGFDEDVLVAAAAAIADCVSAEDRRRGRVSPDVFDPRIVPAVAAAVGAAARARGLAPPDAEKPREAMAAETV